MKELIINGTKVEVGTKLKVVEDCTHVFVPGDEVIVCEISFRHGEWTTLNCVQADVYEKYKILADYMTSEWNIMLPEELTTVEV